MNRTTAAVTGMVTLILAGGLAFGAQRLQKPSAPVADGQETCRIVDGTNALPIEARESSGLVRSIDRPDVFWTHNDSGNEPELFGVDATGSLVARVRLDGAQLVDWEDIEAARCAAGSCLYVADTGDNDGDREQVTVYELAEPEAGAGRARVTAYHARYPDGRHDAEALFAVGGELYVVTKGRRGPVRLYRFPLETRGVATLELIVELRDEPSNAEDRVTAATATPDGRWVAIRTHAALRFHDAARLLAGEPAAAHSYELASVGHAQGESVAMDDAGNVWLTSEAEADGRPGFSRLSCPLN